MTHEQVVRSELAQGLRDRRREPRLSQAALAARASMGRNTVYHIECCEASCTVPQLVSLSRALDAHASIFIDAAERHAAELLEARA